MRLLFGTPDASGIEHQRFNEDQSARLRLRKVRLLSPTSTPTCCTNRCCSRRDLPSQCHCCHRSSRRTSRRCCSPRRSPASRGHTRADVRYHSLRCSRLHHRNWRRSFRPHPIDRYPRRSKSHRRRRAGHSRRDPHPLPWVGGRSSLDDRFTHSKVLSAAQMARTSFNRSFAKLTMTRVGSSL